MLKLMMVFGVLYSDLVGPSVEDIDENVELFAAIGTKVDNARG